MPRDTDVELEQRVRLCVVGNLLIDVILRGVAAMPGWGQEVVCSSRLEVVAGQGPNLALAASRLGVSTGLIGNVGKDAAGSRIRRELEEAGIQIERVETSPGGSTAMTIALVRLDGERAFLSDLGCLKDFDGAAMARSWSVACDAQVVALVGSSNLPSLDLEQAARMFAQARECGTVTVFDPGWDPYGWQPATLKGIAAVLAQTEIFLPNQDEAAALTQQDDVRLMLRALAEWCPGVVVIKCGAAGSWCLRQGDVFRVDPLPAEVDNAVGAGDVYDAGVIAGYLSSGDVLEGMIVGTAAASLYVSRRSSRFPELRETMALKDKVLVSHERLAR